MKNYPLFFAKKIVLRYISHIKYGYIEFIDERKCFSAGNPADLALKVSVNVIKPDFYKRVLKNGSVGAAESFILGEWQVDDLTKLIQILIKNQDTLKKFDGKFASFKILLSSLKNWLNKNTVRGSKKNIIKHYDLGNDFFSLFLDKSMMYSSAIYPHDNSSLEEAAEYKLKIICDKLDLKPEHHILEIGSGWGGFALYAAKNYQCKVTTTTISEEQYRLAKEKIISAGLVEQITLLKNDYRELTGQFDKVVSIEMLEAVGHSYLKTYFQKISYLLKTDGQALIQVITITDQHYERAKYEADFIKQYIFPGGFLPSLTAIAKTLTQYTDLRITDIEDIGLHYAKTLRDWLNRFNQVHQQLFLLGYDQFFIRMWQYYFCYCEAAFLEQYISDMQIILMKSKGVR